MADVPARLEDVVTERVRTTFAELMPEEQWRALVQRAITDFTRPGGGRDRSPLQEMVNQALKARFAGEIKAALEAPEFVSMWGVAGQQPSDAIKAMLRELAPEIVAAAYGSMFQGAVESVRRALAEQMQRPY